MRILIFGRPGSGKSTYAVNLGGQLKLPVYHLDKIFFESHWKKRDGEDFLKLQQIWADQPDWIIDGNGMATIERRYSKADIAIYFNFPWYLCLWRIFKRFWYRDPRIDDRAPNSPEKVSWMLVKYLFQFRSYYNHRIYSLVRTYPNVQFIEVKTDSAAHKLLE